MGDEEEQQAWSHGSVVFFLCKCNTVSMIALQRKEELKSDEFHGNR